MMPTEDHFPMPSQQYPFRRTTHLPAVIRIIQKRQRSGFWAAAFVLSTLLVFVPIVLLGCSQVVVEEIEPVQVEPALPVAMEQILTLKPAPPPAVLVVPLAPAKKRWEGVVPDWILRGILRRETKSYLQGQKVIYVDKSRGAAGERGPTQILPAAFKDVRRPGESYWKVEVDTDFALEVTVRYLVLLRKQTGTWESAIRAYNVGAGRCQDAGRGYYEDVRRLGGRS